MAHINFQEPPRFSWGQLDFKIFRSFELNYFWMMVILCAFLLFMLTFGLAQRSRVLGMNAKLIAAVADLKASSGEQPAKKGEAPKATLRDSLMQRVVWSPILNAIANHTPDTIALNYIKGASAGSRSLQLEGTGADVLASVRYENELSTLPVFSKVFLSSATGAGGGASSGAAKPGASLGAKADAALSGSSGDGGSKTARSTFEIQAWLK